MVDAASAEGLRRSRSATQQLDHWVRLGRAVSQSETAERHRIEAALAGSLPMRELTAEEGVVFNAEISAAVEENLAGSHYGQLLAGEGVTTVALDEQGRLRARAEVTTGYDNSGISGPRIVAQLAGGATPIGAVQWPPWAPEPLSAAWART